MRTPAHVDSYQPPFLDVPFYPEPKLSALQALARKLSNKTKLGLVLVLCPNPF